MTSLLSSRELVLVGGFALHLILGTIYTYGSYSPYLVSYLRKFNAKLTYEDAMIIYALQIGGQAALMFLGGWLEKPLGPRKCAALGSILLVAGPLLAAQSTQLWAVALTLGAMFGAGVGLVYMAPVLCGLRWSPDRAGLVSGVVVSGFGASALIFNQVETVLANPGNARPDVEYHGKLYYAAGPVTDAVPNMLRILGAIYACLAVLGISLLKEPPSDHFITKDNSSVIEADVETKGVCQDVKASIGVPRQKAEEEVLLKDRSPSRRPCCPSPARNGQQSCVTGSRERKDDIQVKDMAPSQLLWSPQAYLVALCMMLGALGGLCVLGTYKSFGYAMHVDDRFITTVVGSLASVTNALGRLFWGLVSDRYGYYSTLRFAAVLQSLFLCSWILTTDLWSNAWLFATWVSVITFCHGGVFSVYPPFVAQLFGSTHSGPNYGLIFIMYGIAALMGITLLPRLSTHLSPLNFILGGIAFSSALGLLLLERWNRLTERSSMGRALVEEGEDERKCGSDSERIRVS